MIGLKRLIGLIKLLKLKKKDKNKIIKRKIVEIRFTKVNKTISIKKKSNNSYKIKIKY